MRTYSFSELDEKEALKGFSDKTKSFILRMLKLFKEIDSNKISPMSSITVCPDKNLCTFELISYNKSSIKLKIDIFNEYFDFFINNEEVVIQKEIFPEEKSTEMIHAYLGYQVEEITLERVSDKEIRKQINFYKNNKKVESIGSILIFSFIFNKKQKRITKYYPWIR